MNLIKKTHSMYKELKNATDTKAEVIKKTETILQQTEEVNESTPQSKTGKAFSCKVIFDQCCVNTMKNRYIAFDVETTGLNPKKDRIVEVGAVLFENGVEKGRFQSLVNPQMQIPKEATKINGITNEMLLNAPEERDVYKKLCIFLGDAIQKKTIICAHNADFDMNFLREALSRNGMDANIYFLDTLQVARELVENLKNYKQTTVAEHFEIEVKNAHRACDDAAVCGKIMKKLLEIKYGQIKKNMPNELEEEICKYIQNIIIQKGGKTHYLRFQRLSSGHIAASYLYNFIKFRIGKNKYIIIPQKVAKKLNVETEKCSKMEGDGMVRYYFDKTEELDVFSEYIYNEFIKTQKEALSYINSSDGHYAKVMKIIGNLANYN